MARKKTAKNDSDKKRKPVEKTKRYVSLSDLAEHFKFSVQAVSKWTVRGCPIVEKGGVGKPYIFDLDKVKKWYADYSRKNTGDNGGGVQGTLNLGQESARLNSFKADLAELDLKTRLGELVDAEEVRTVWLKLITATRSKLIVLPKKLAPQVYGCKTQAETVAVLEAEIHDILRDLAAPDFTIATIGKDGDRGDGKVRPAAKAKRKRVGGRKKNVKPRVKR